MRPAILFFAIACAAVCSALRHVPPLLTTLAHRRQCKVAPLQSSFDVDPVVIAEGAAVLGGLYGLFKVFIYSKFQYTQASIIGGIPISEIGNKVVEIDARDGKNVFYLPKNSDYTAIMMVDETDEKKRRDKLTLNEQLILECVGKANINSMNLRGRVRGRSQEIPSKSMDCVISTGGLARSTEKGELLNEVYRMLRPGGVFVFVEPESKETISLLEQTFPREIVPTTSSKDSKVGGKLESKLKNKKYKKKQTLEMELNEMSEGSNVSEVEETPTTSDIADTADASSSGALPGLTFDVISNFGIENFISGIAVRP